MYINQLKDKNLNLFLYLPLPIIFCIILVFNYFASLEVDTSQVIQNSIQQIGVNATFVTMLLPLVFGFFIVLIWGIGIQRISITQLTTGRKKIDIKRIVFSFAVWSCFSILFTVINYIFDSENFIWNFNAKNFFSFLVIALLLLPLQTSFEEYLFRGHLLQGIGLATNNKWLALLVTSVIFGMLHLANPEVTKLGSMVMIYYIVTGLFLGYITLLDDGLELALGFHAANNIIGALLVTSDWTVFQTHSLFKNNTAFVGIQIIFPLLIAYPILFYIFSRKYKWKNWKLN